MSNNSKAVEVNDTVKGGGDGLMSLRAVWTELYSQILPSLARSRDPAQSKWPVTLDHCFARIILDNTVGRGVLQWDRVIDKPAVRKMDAAQLREAIELGEKIKDGSVDLVALDLQSLEARGKAGGKYKALGGKKSAATAETKKKATSEFVGDKGDRERDDENEDKKLHRKRGIGDDNDEEAAYKKQKKNSQSDTRRQATLSFSKSSSDPSTTRSGLKSSPSSKSTAKEDDVKTDPNISHLISKIQHHPGLTLFRKRLYSTLLSVPEGHYTTYAAMATYLSSSARAVGNGMRNNPFAPDVPCHRVLAANGTLGGFGGDWGVEGKHAGKKIDLLAGEGVRFDSRGKVKGAVFVDLKDLSESVGG